jgi:hypothetical protein
MLRTIEELSELKKEGKYKWAKDLIMFLIPYFESGRSYEEIIKMLASKHEIFIDKNELAQYKYRYYPKQQKNKTFLNQNNQTRTQNELNGTSDDKIAQNQDLKNDSSSDSEYVDFTEGLDENIAEKQKRERDLLFKTNLKGAKW